MARDGGKPAPKKVNKASDGEMSRPVKFGIVALALALAPTLVVLSRLTDNSEVLAQQRAERIALQDAKNRQLEYDEINRRLGNK
ncbi:hypothetical protein [Aureimonas psammosilenae]|uniref:hypothetical protein n=1 Tax=Aureimonas psammosilenae TaxID=2495496 RepID=UPI001260D83C|nr:hypothetical protein [Aureimonas psammosilenae]